MHRRYDVSGPLETAWRLPKRWTSSRLCILDDAVHGGADSFPAALTEAVRQVAAQPRVWATLSELAGARRRLSLTSLAIS